MGFVALIAGGCDSNADPAKDGVGSAKPAVGPSGDKLEKQVAQNTKNSHVGEGGAQAAQDDSRMISSPAAGAANTFEDPEWYSPALYEGAKVTKTGRSELDANGKFSSMMLLELPAGTTLESCVKTFKDGVKGSLTDLTEKPQGERIEVKGSNGEITAVLMCGEVKGAMTAYVSYYKL
ncbi:MAG: hypothetical protein ACPG4T_04035 [Nannocystaceae bacterium]